MQSAENTGNPSTTMSSLKQANANSAMSMPTAESPTRQLQAVLTPSGKEMIISTIPKQSATATVQLVQTVPTNALQVLGNTPSRIIHPPGGPLRTPGSSGGIKRPLEYDFNTSVRKFPRSTDKSKGLRHFSTKVCEKVREKVVTNYNEVADELVQEYFESMPNPPASQEKQVYDQKNIRRRVYDALNVLMAMNIISKEKKEIRWVGLPTSSVQECKKLEDEKTRRLERIRQKTEQLQDLIVQLVAFKSLVERNKQYERVNGKPLANSILFLPYIVIHTDRRTIVDCNISNDKAEYMFTFDRPFEIHDDVEVLKRLGMTHGLDRGQVDPNDITKLKSYLPPALRDYIDQIVQNRLFAKFPPVPPAHSGYGLGHRVPIAAGLGTAERLYGRPIKRESGNFSGLDSSADMEVAMALAPGQMMEGGVKGMSQRMQQQRGPTRIHGQHALPHHSYYSLGQGGRLQHLRGAGIIGRGRLQEPEMAMYEEEDASRESYGSDDLPGDHGY